MRSVGTVHGTEEVAFVDRARGARDDVDVRVCRRRRRRRAAEERLVAVVPSAPGLLLALRSGS